MEVCCICIIGAICLIDNKFEWKNILGEIINVIIYLFAIMITVLTIDVLFFGEKVDIFSKEERILRIIKDYYRHCACGITGFSD